MPDDCRRRGDDQVHPLAEHVVHRRSGATVGNVQHLDAGVAGELLGPDMLDRADAGGRERSEEHTSELQSLMRISYAVFCLKKKKQTNKDTHYKLNNK